MQVPPSESIKDLLVAAGYVFGGTADWAVFCGHRPDEPENCIAIYDSGGAAPNPRWLIDQPSVNIKIRASAGNAREAFMQATKVKSILLGIPSQEINGDQWVHINMAGDIGYLGLDSRSQPEYNMNFNMIIEPAKTVTDHREAIPGRGPAIDSFTSEFTEEFF